MASLPGTAGCGDRRRWLTAVSPPGYPAVRDVVPQRRRRGSRPQAGVADRSPPRAPTRAPPSQTIDLHCAGEPLRLIRSGFPKVPMAPILERRRWVREHADHARRAVMYEPRGHRDMYGAILLSPHRPDADIAVLFMHNEGYSTMCGHGTIAITTALIEEGLFPATEPQTTIRLETPAGLVTAVADVTRGRHGGPEVSSVRFTNVPAYVAATDLTVRSQDVALGVPGRRQSAP